MPKLRLRLRALALVTAVTALLVVAPRAFAVESSLSIESVTLASGGRVTISGSVVVGIAAREAKRVFLDPQGDSANLGLAPDGLDLGSGSIRMTSDGTLVFTIITYNMSPAGISAPTFVYNWNVDVDGVDSGYFLQAGFVGGWATAYTGKFFNVCRRAGDVTCTSLGPAGGTIGTPINTVAINVTPAQIRARPGSVISAGSTPSAACVGVCSTWQPVVFLFYNTGGDQATPTGYIVPGGVQLTVVPITTTDEEIDWSKAVSPNVQPNGDFSGTFGSGLISGVEYKAAARTCSGSSDAPVCLLTTKTFTA